MFPPPWWRLKLQISLARDPIDKRIKNWPYRENEFLRSFAIVNPSEEVGKRGKGAKFKKNHYSRTSAWNVMKFFFDLVDIRRHHYVKGWHLCAQWGTRYPLCVISCQATFNWRGAAVLSWAEDFLTLRLWWDVYLFRKQWLDLLTHYSVSNFQVVSRFYQSSFLDDYVRFFLGFLCMGMNQSSWITIL